MRTFIELRRAMPYIAVSIAGLLVACNGGGSLPPNFPTGQASPTSPAPTGAPAPLPVASYLQSVTVIDPAQVPHGASALSGTVPEDGTGPAITMTNGSGTANAVIGGSVLLTFDTSIPASALLVGVSGVAGYYSADLTTSTTTQSVGRSGETWIYEPKTNTSVRVRVQRDARASGQTIASYVLSIVIPPDVALSSFVVTLVARFANTQSSPPSRSTFSIVPGGNTSGSFQATLGWRAPVDLDLHVRPPDGSEIGYNNKNSAGGSLDVDSNADCNIDNTNQENVTWATGTAPAGVYRVRPDYYRSCSVTAPVQYNLTIRTADTEASPSRQPAVYVNTFTTEDRNSSSGDSFAVVYGSVLPPVSTDAGLTAHLILAEIGSPGSSQYSLQAATTAARAIRAIVENRKYSPGTFAANSAATKDIIFAKNVQFAGFNPNGMIDGSIRARFAQELFPSGSAQPDTTRTDWIPFWNAILLAATQPYSERVNDPFASARMSLTASYVLDSTGNPLPSVAVSGGTYGVRTAQHPYSSTTTDVMNFRLVGNADGQDFYSLNSAFRPAPPTP